MADWTRLGRPASLGLFLTFQLKSVLGKGESETAELAGLMTGMSDKTIREWRDKFFESGGAYQRSGVVWTNETKASRYICENATKKGVANLTTDSFCQWVNDSLLPN